MKKLVASIVLMLALTVMAQAGEVVFVESYDAALQKATQADQKLLITFFSPT